MPHTRSGCSMPAAIAVTESDDVFVVRIARGPHASASRANSSRFRSRFSGAASITSSQPARSSSRGTLGLLRTPQAPVHTAQETGAKAVLACVKSLADRGMEVAPESFDAGDL